MDVHTISLKGKRDNNEDKHIVILNKNNSHKKICPVNFFGLFDGHGGKYVSKYISVALPAKIMNTKTIPAKKFVNDAFNDVQKELMKHAAYTTYCGSTALVMLNYKAENHEYIQLYNSGDCRAVLCRDNLAIPLTKDHKPMWPEEKRRIEKLGGIIKTAANDDPRIKDLSVSRAFGDLNAMPYVTHVPDSYRYKLEKNDKFIVLGCDGLYDVLQNQEIVNFVLNFYYDAYGKKIKKNNIAKQLAEYALYKGSMDNVSVIIVFFD